MDVAGSGCDAQEGERGRMFSLKLCRTRSPHHAGGELGVHRTWLLFLLCSVTVDVLVQGTCGPLVTKEHIGAGLDFLLGMIPGRKSRQMHGFYLVDKQVVEWRNRDGAEGTGSARGRSCSPDALQRF